LYYLGDKNPELLSGWMRILESTGEISVGYHHLAKAQEDFAAYSSSTEAIISTMKDVWENNAYLLCPHCATTIHAAKSLQLDSVKTICMATAHPAKFSNILMMALPDLDYPCSPFTVQNLPQIAASSGPVRYPIIRSLRELKGFLHQYIGADKDDKNRFYALAIVATIIIGMALFQRRFR
jgi:threonine synthase